MNFRKQNFISRKTILKKIDLRENMNIEKSKILQNRKKTPEKIQEIVEEIMKNKVTTKPFDFLFRDNVNQYPQTNHELLQLPGKFKNKESTGVFVKGYGSMEMDFAESILPDNIIIKREAAINLEQETGEISDEKKEAIFDYCLSTTIKLKKPCYPFVATNHEYKTDFLVCEIEGILLKINLIIFDKKKIYEILNTLNEKDYSKEEFNEVDYLLFIYSFVFAKKPYAFDVVEKLAIIFQSLNNINQELQIELYLAFITIIKYHFMSDENKIKELLTMITEVMQEEVIEDLPNYERRTQQIIELNEKLANSEKERLKLSSEKDAEISEKDAEISEKNKIIQDLRKELEKYKK